MLDLVWWCLALVFVLCAQSIIFLFQFHLLLVVVVSSHEYSIIIISIKLVMCVYSLLWQIQQSQQVGLTLCCFFHWSLRSNIVYCAGWVLTLIVRKYCLIPAALLFHVGKTCHSYACQKVETHKYVLITCRTDMKKTEISFTFSHTYSMQLPPSTPEGGGDAHLHFSGLVTTTTIYLEMVWTVLPCCFNRIENSWLIPVQFLGFWTRPEEVDVLHLFELHFPLHPLLPQFDFLSLSDT